MNKKTFITILLAIIALTLKAQVKSHIIGSVAEGTTPVELVIYRDGKDPKDSKLRPVVKDGHFECDVDTQIERWHIVDFGEMMKKGMTSRSEAFLLRMVRLSLSDLTMTSSISNLQARNTKYGKL